MRVLVPTAGRRNILLDAIRSCPQVTRLVTTEIDFTAPGVTAADVCYRAPRTELPEFLDCMESICRRERITHILPLSDLDLIRFAGCGDRFGALGTAVLSVPEAAVHLCMDKWATHRFLMDIGIPVPETVRFDTVSEDGSGVSYPVCLKPRSAGMKSSKWYYFARLGGPEDLLRERVRLIGREAEYLVQEHLEGRRELNIDFYAQGGELKRLVALHRHGWGAGGGITRGTTIPCPPQVRDMAEKIIRALSYDGPGNFQVWEDAAGKYAVTEINPRFSNSSALVCIPAGENFFGLLFDSLAGRDVPSRFDAYKMLTVTCAYVPKVVSEDVLEDPFA